MNLKTGVPSTQVCPQGQQHGTGITCSKILLPWGQTPALHRARGWGHEQETGPGAVLTVQGIASTPRVVVPENGRWLGSLILHGSLHLSPDPGNMET